MDLHKKYSLTTIINGAGTFTPLGVSRSSPNVANLTAQALENFFVMEELQQALSSLIARWTGAQAGAVVHCVSSAITLSIAGIMAGSDADKVATLPDTAGLSNEVVLPAGHAINYGHSILQDIRLAGANPILAGSEEYCSLGELTKQLTEPDTACLLLVASRLVMGETIDLTAAVAAAHSAGVPAIIDCAAQDMRIPELLSSGADLILVSAHKYLASPTAGLIIGNKELVQAAHAHEKGIGRSMKASKEAIIGVMAAIEEREKLDLDVWRADQDKKLGWFIKHANRIDGVTAKAIADIAGMPFSRASLLIEPLVLDLDAASVATKLKSGNPSIRVMEYALHNNEIILELVPLVQQELEIIVARLSQICAS